MIQQAFFDVRCDSQRAHQDDDGIIPPTALQRHSSIRHVVTRRPSHSLWKSHRLHRFQSRTTARLVDIVCITSSRQNRPFKQVLHRLLPLGRTISPQQAPARGSDQALRIRQKDINNRHICGQRRRGGHSVRRPATTYLAVGKDQVL